MGQAGPLTLSQITAATGLSAPTVGGLSIELVKLGLLTELGRGPSTGGRPPRSIQFNTHYGVVAGIVVDVARTRLAIADLAGETLASSETRTACDGGPERLLSWLGEQIRILLSTTAPAGRLLAVAAGLPGAVDRERGTVVGLMPGFRSFENLAVGAYLER